MARLRRFRLPCDLPRENDREWTQIGYKQRKVGRSSGRPLDASRHTGGGHSGARHMVLATCGTDRKVAADGIRAVVDESSCAVGWQRVRHLGRNNWIWQLPDDVAGRAQHLDLENGNLTRP